MTTFNSALSGGQKTKVRSASFQADHNVSLFGNRVVFKCQVNVDLSVGVVFAAFTYYNATIGAYTDVEVGQTILVAPVDDITQWVWRGRVRLAPDASNIYCNETQTNWSPNYYVYVIDTFEVWDRLSRPDTSTPPVQYVDFNEAYHKLAPSIQGLQYVYAGTKDSGTGKFRITLSLTGIAVESGASISTWLISPRAGQATLISGSYSSAVATFDLDPTTMTTWGETWFSVKATDSNGNSLTRHCGVKIYDGTHTPDLNFENPDLSNDIARGWTLRLPAFAGVDSVLPWTLVCLWRENEVYGGVSGALNARNNIDFIGYLRKDDPQVVSDPKYGVLGTTTFEVIDVAARMANVEMQALGIFNDTTAAWDHINNATPRRALWHCLTTHSTVANLVDVAFDSFLSDDRYVFPDFSTQGGNLLTAFNGIAAQVNAAFEFGPDGTIEVNRDLRQTDASTRAAAPIILDLQATGGANDDCIVIGSSRVYEDRIGIVDANGAGYNVPPVYQSRAPGLAQGISQGRTSLANQVLANDTGLNMQAELNQRAGNQYNIENSQETITLELPDGYTFGVASRAQFYTLTANTDLVGPNGVSRIIYTSSVLWQLEQVSYRIEPAKGGRKVNWTLRRVCPIGLPGYSVVFPPAPTASVVPFGVVPPAFGLDPLLMPALGVSVPPPNPTPTKPKATVPTLDWTATNVWVSFNFPSMASPTRANITPTDLGSFQIQHVIADLADLSLKAIPAYLLANDGTNSAVWYTPNILPSLPTWTKGANVSGTYQLVRLTQTPGSIMIYTPDSAGTITTTNFLSTDGGYVNLTNVGNTPNTSGQWVLSTGWQATAAADGTGGHSIAVDIKKTFAAATVTAVAMHFHKVNGTFNSGTVNDAIILQHLGGSVGSVSVDASTENGTLTLSWTGSVTADEIDLHIRASFWAGGGSDGSGEITSVSVETTTGGGAKAVLSANYGSTWSAPVSVGTSISGQGGFDVQHAGAVSFAASDQEINKATTLGGAYSAFLATTGAEPIAILSPWYVWGSTSSKNTGGTPNFCYGTNAAVGGETFWLVVGSTATANSPSITGTKGIIVGPNAITTWKGTRIAGLFSFSGTVHLMTGVITNSGTPAITWTDRGVHAGAYARGAYHAASPGPLFVAGDASEWYAADYGATLNTRTPPVTSGILGLEPCG